MNSKEYREFVRAYQSVYEQQQAPQKIGVKTDNPYRTLQQMVDRQKLGGKVVIPKGELPLANSYEPEGEQIDEFSLPGTGNVMAPRGMSLGYQQKFLGMNVGPRKELPLNKTYSDASVRRYNANPNAPSTLQKMGVGPLANRHISVPKSTAVSTSTSQQAARPTAKPQTASAAMAKAFKGVPLLGKASDVANEFDKKANYRNADPELRKLMRLKNSYEPEGELIEDIEQRRKQLAQRSKEGIEGFKQRISARVNANRKRLAKKREKEQLKRELKSEFKN